MSTELKLNEPALIGVLKSSLYPGASDQSVALVLSYCKAAGLDPMQKPVHIVPIYSKSAGGMIDTVMPGIGLYRTQAARSGQYAGVSEPDFGPDVTAKLSGVEVTYPAWCRVTVRRLMQGGQVAEFTAREFWLENYATAKRDTSAPNAMWQRRAYGQLAKCAEAQALRKAFPEFGAAPTAEEMEGKSAEPMGAVESVAVEVPEDLIREADEAASCGMSAYSAFWQRIGADKRKLLVSRHAEFKAAATLADERDAEGVAP